MEWYAKETMMSHLLSWRWSATVGAFLIVTAPTLACSILCWNKDTSKLWIKRGPAAPRPTTRRARRALSTQALPLAPPVPPGPQPQIRLRGPRNRRAGRFPFFPPRVATSSRSRAPRAGLQSVATSLCDTLSSMSQFSSKFNSSTSTLCAVTELESTDAGDGKTPPPG